MQLDIMEELNEGPLDDEDHSSDESYETSLCSSFDEDMIDLRENNLLPSKRDDDDDDDLNGGIGRVGRDFEDGVDGFR